jgi:hypothetical protein
METIIFTHPGLNLSENVLESIFVALLLSQFCFSYGTLLPIVFPHTKTYLPYMTYTKEKDEYATFVERNWGQRELLTMSERQCGICYLSDKFSVLFEVQWLDMAQDTQDVSKMLGQTSGAGPTPEQGKKVISTYVHKQF